MPLILGSNAPTGGYEVDNSLRFDDGSTDHLDRTFASAGNRKTFTISFWAKLTGNITPGQSAMFGTIFDAALNGSNSDDLYFHTHRLNFSGFYGSTQYHLRTNAKYRDPSAWYHFVVAFDTTQGTASNRIKMYANGVQETSFETETYPSLNFQTTYMNTARLHNIGTLVDGDGFPLDGYLAEFVFIDGQQLDPTSFGEFDEDSGIWKPIDVSGLTFGTNGFYLPFENSADLGQDDSGNGNDFTLRNLTSIDQTTDTPTNNFCTLNPIAVDPSSGASTLSDGNTSVNNAGSSRCFGSTLAVSKGKYYWEYKMIDLGDIVGARSIDEVASGANLFTTSKSFGVYYDGNSALYINGSSQGNIGTSTDTANDIAMFALDCDNNKIYLGLNGNWTTGIGNGYDTSTFASANDFTIDSDILWTVDMTNGSSVTAHDGAFNFGNPPFTISSGNSDANGYGNFEYAVPSGYYALCTKNLAEYG